MFLGTPHAGADLLADMATKFARVTGIFKQANADILEVLRNDSAMSAKIQNDFYSMLRANNSLDITCCFEELGVPGTGKVGHESVAKIRRHSYSVCLGC
jgi:hypothetical protein